MTQQPSNPGDTIVERLQMQRQMLLALTVKNISITDDHVAEISRVMLAAITELQSRRSGGERAAVVEECARVAEKYGRGYGGVRCITSLEIARIIRSLSQRGAAEGEGEQP